MRTDPHLFISSFSSDWAAISGCFIGKLVFMTKEPDLPGQFVGPDSGEDICLQRRKTWLVRRKLNSCAVESRIDEFITDSLKEVFVALLRFKWNKADFARGSIYRLLPRNKKILMKLDGHIEEGMDEI